MKTLFNNYLKMVICPHSISSPGWYISLSRLKISIEPTSPPHLSQMLHNKEQSKRKCSSPFKSCRVDHPTPSCGPPLEELQSTSSLQRDIQHGLPHLIPLQTSLDIATTKSSLATTPIFSSMMAVDCQTPFASGFFCSQQRDEVACSSSRQGTYPATPRWCPANSGWASWHGAERRGFLN